MSGNYPPGVTGNEFEIAGPEYEKESDIPCGKCGGQTFELGYRREHWIACSCGWTTDLEREEPDPDRAHDEAVERRLFGDD